MINMPRLVAEIASRHYTPTPSLAQRALARAQPDPQTAQLDLSSFSVVGDTVQLIATTTASGAGAPDWKQHIEPVKIENRGDQKLVTAHLYPKSIYTFAIEAILR
jgi:hypothetical protein